MTQNKEIEMTQRQQINPESEVSRLLQINQEQELIEPDNQRLKQIKDSWKLKKTRQNTKKIVQFCGYTCSRNKFIAYSVLLVVVLIIVVPILVIKNLPKHHKDKIPDSYGVALQKSLLFFDAQMAGKLPTNKRIPWRRDSGLNDHVSGGYYDAGGIVKYTYPMAYSLTILSWTAIEYRQKLLNLGEFKHLREIIKHGTDYLLASFDASAGIIIFQVGIASNVSGTCWQRPEDVEEVPKYVGTQSGADLAAEMASALASASIVFADNRKYSQRLIKGAAALFEFARDKGKQHRYNDNKPEVQQSYNSSGYFDELLWGASWMYTATGKSYYLSFATNPEIAAAAKVFNRTPASKILSWDNKLPAMQLLTTRIRIFLSPGYPFEEMLSAYHKYNDLNLCSYLKRFTVFNYTQGGMIILNPRKPQNLQYVVGVAFIASLYADYLIEAGLHGWNCGDDFVTVGELQNFATSQVKYILGDNSMQMSYLVGYGTHFPTHVHHMGASIPNDGHKYSCIEGLKWRNSKNANPNNLTGGLVGGPNKDDFFLDDREKREYTEATLYGNAGLVAALASLTKSGGIGVHSSAIFSKFPLPPPSLPPPPPWNPGR